MAGPQAKPKSFPLVSTLKGIYYDPWQWQLAKSWGMFAVGVYLARDFTSYFASVAEQTI